MQYHPKPLTVTFGAALAVVLLLFSNIGQGLTAEGAAATPAVLGIDDFMKNVDRYQGKVSLEGVVSAVAPEQQVISLIDVKEFQACNVTTCAQLTLPVQWRGPMPAVRDLVRVVGQTQEIKGKLIFGAEKLDKVPRP